MRLFAAALLAVLAVLIVALGVVDGSRSRSLTAGPRVTANAASAPMMLAWPASKPAVRRHGRPWRPKIVVQPRNVVVPAGRLAGFTAAASGVPAPWRQWQCSTNRGRTWKNIPGAHRVTLTFTAKRAQSGTKYRAVFTNAAGRAITRVALLTVGARHIDSGRPGSPTDGGTGSGRSGESSGPERERVPRGVRQSRRQRRHQRCTLVVASNSGNWAGYIALGQGFGSVTGSRSVPAVTCPESATTYSSQWVGIDGVEDATVEQDGTESDCVGGVPTYSAWYAMWGDIPSPSPAPQLSSAEWVVERPVEGDALAALSDFSTASFTSAAATDTAASGPISAFTDMPSEITGGSSTALATPGPLAGRRRFLRDLGREQLIRPGEMSPNRRKPRPAARRS